MRIRLLLLAALAAAMPATVAAHAGVRSVQERGDTLVVALSSGAESAFLSVGAGATVTLDRADDHVLRVTAPGGAATTTVRVLSRDGHVSRLELTAGRVTGDARVDTPGVVVGRLLILGALVVLLGLVGVLVVVVVPAWRTPIRPPGADPGRLELDPGSPTPGLRTVRTLTLGAALAGALGTVILVVATLASLGVGVGGLGRLLGQTRLGAAAVAYVIVFTLSGVVSVALGRSARPRPWWGWVVAAPPIVGVGVLSWSGHATAGDDRVLSFGLDAVHVIATCLWFGGLLGLLLAMGALSRLGDPDRVRPTLAAIVVRFSAMALLAVGVLVVTGVYRALAELRGFGDLLHTDYGVTLLVKLVLFGVMLCVAAYNRFVLHPRLERASLGLRDDDRGAARALRMSVRAELGLAATVIVTVALLISMPPP